MIILLQFYFVSHGLFLSPPLSFSPPPPTHVPFSAQNIINETAEVLSVLCINICRMLDPEFIVIGECVLYFYMSVSV